MKGKIVVMRERVGNSVWERKMRMRNREVVFMIIKK